GVVEGAHDVGMHHAGSITGLTEESLHGRRVGPQPLLEDFHGREATFGVLGAVHRRGAPFADLLKQAISGNGATRKVLRRHERGKLTSALEVGQVEGKVTQRWLKNCQLRSGTRLSSPRHAAPGSAWEASGNRRRKWWFRAFSSQPARTGRWASWHTARRSRSSGRSAFSPVLPPIRPWLSSRFR